MTLQFFAQREKTLLIADKIWIGRVLTFYSLLILLAFSISKNLSSFFSFFISAYIV